MTPLVAVGVGVFVGAVYAIGERSLVLGLKVAGCTAVAAFIGGNLF